MTRPRRHGAIQGLTRTDLSTTQRYMQLGSGGTEDVLRLPDGNPGRKRGKIWRHWTRDRRGFVPLPWQVQCCDGRLRMPARTVYFSGVKTNSSSTLPRSSVMNVAARRSLTKTW